MVEGWVGSVELEGRCTEGAGALAVLLRRLRGHPHQSANQHICEHLPYRKEMVCCEVANIFKSLLQRAYSAMSLGQVQYIQIKRKLMTQTSPIESPETKYLSLVLRSCPLEQ